jgi:hypothetical protein
MIPHALAEAPAALALLVAVVLAALLGLAVVGPGQAVGPPAALGTTGQAAVDVAAEAAAVDGEEMAAGATADEEKLQVPSARSEELDLGDGP